MGHPLHYFVGDVASIESGKDKDIGAPFQRGAGGLGGGDARDDCRVKLHLTIDDQGWVCRPDSIGRHLDLGRGRVPGAAPRGKGQHGNARYVTCHRPIRGRRLLGDGGEFFCCRVHRQRAVREDQRCPVRQHHQEERRHQRGAFSRSDAALGGGDGLACRGDRTADGTLSEAHMHHHRRMDQGATDHVSAPGFGEVAVLRNGAKGLGHGAKLCCGAVSGGYDSTFSALPPIRIGWAKPSCATRCAASITRGSAPSASTIRFGDRAASAWIWSTIFMDTGYEGDLPSTSPGRVWNIISPCAPPKTGYCLTVAVLPGSFRANSERFNP